MNGSKVKLYVGNFMLTLKVNTIQKPLRKTFAFWAYIMFSYIQSLKIHKKKHRTMRVNCHENHFNKQCDGRYQYHIILVDISFNEMSEKTSAVYRVIFGMYLKLFILRKSILFMFTRKDKRSFHFEFAVFKYNQFTLYMRNIFIL